MAESVDEASCGVATIRGSGRSLFTSKSVESEKTKINFGDFGHAMLPGYMWKFLQTSGFECEKMQDT